MDEKKCFFVQAVYCTLFLLGKVSDLIVMILMVLIIFKIYVSDVATLTNPFVNKGLMVALLLNLFVFLT